MVMDLQSIGLPHSEIPGSRVICTSPELIAAYHVLLRLREPRHPPVALSYFFYFVLNTVFKRFSASKQYCSFRINLAIKFCFDFIDQAWSMSSLLYYLKLFQYVKERWLRLSGVLP